MKALSAINPEAQPARLYAMNESPIMQAMRQLTERAHRLQIELDCAKAERDLLVQALRNIAAGDLYTSPQAHSYKNEARRALKMTEV